MGLGSTLSVAVTVKETRAPEGAVASAWIGSGTVRVGGVVSRTVIVENAEPTLLAASVAVQVTAVVPNGKVEPEDGEQVRVRDPLTRSVAEAENVATAPAGPVASKVTGNPDIDTSGGVVSRRAT